MLQPRNTEDSLLACVAFALTGSELTIPVLRRECLHYFSSILYGNNKLGDTLIDSCINHLAVRKWCRESFNTDSWDAFNNRQAQMCEKAQQLITDPSICPISVITILAASIYRVKIHIDDKTITPETCIFQNKGVKSVYIKCVDGIYTLKTTFKTMIPRYALRVSNGTTNRHIGDFSPPGEKQTVYWLHLSSYRTDLIYQIYPGESDRFRLSIPENYTLYVFGAGKSVTCLASASGKFNMYPFFCLPVTTTFSYLAVVLSDDIRNAKKSVIKECPTLEDRHSIQSAHSQL